MQKIDLKVYIALYRAKNRIDRKMTKLFKKYKISVGQFGVLEALYHKGSLSVGEVSEKILSTAGTIPMIVSNLEKNGYIKKEKDPKDGRRSNLSLTKKGLELIEEVYPQNEKIILDSFKCFDEKEKKELLSLLKKLSFYNE